MTSAGRSGLPSGSVNSRPLSTRPLLRRALSASWRPQDIHGGEDLWPPESLLDDARRVAGMSQDERARRAHTSRSTLSACEHGRKSPTLETAARLLAEVPIPLGSGGAWDHAALAEARDFSRWLEVPGKRPDCTGVAKPKRSRRGPATGP